MSKPKDEKEVGCDAVFGSFVTAKLKVENDCRQCWVINVDPPMIRGESGKVYCCEGVPTMVKPQPERAKRRLPREDFDGAIGSANAALYETFIAERSNPATEPKAKKEKKL